MSQTSFYRQAPRRPSVTSGSHSSFITGGGASLGLKKLEMGVSRNVA